MSTKRNMDLLEYVALQIKKGKNPAEIRQLLVKNGYPVYEVENALAVAESKDDAKGKKVSISVNLGSTPGYKIIFALAGILIAIGVVVLFLYFF